MTDPDVAQTPAAPLSRRERREAERRQAVAAEQAAIVRASTADSGIPVVSQEAAAEAPSEPEGDHVDPPPPSPAAPLPESDVLLGTEEHAHAPGPVAPGEVPDTSTPLPPGGRNVPVAIGVGLGLGLLVVASLFFWRKEAFLVVAVIGAGIALWELTRAVAVRDIRLPLLPLLVGTVGMVVSAYTAGVEALLVACVLTAGGAFVWRVLDGGGVPALRDATAAVFATVYVPFMAGFIALMLAADDGPWRVLTFVAVGVANDTGGYVAGVFFGKTRLAPLVSPKKSWEGVIGSCLAASLVGVGMFLGPLDGPWWAGLLLGLAGVAVATLGDLAESLLKRDLGVKDMGDLLPGHGGILDRVDSLLFTAPVAFAIFYAVLGSGR